MISNSNFYVYVFLDPRKQGHYTYSTVSFIYEPFYIGKGCRNRYRAHFAPCNMKYNSHKVSKIRNIIKEGKLPYILKIYIDQSEYNALILENKLIRDIGRYDLHNGPLTNRDDGGPYKNNFSIERREAISIANTGLKRSTEVRKKISQTMTGMKRSQSYIAMLSNNRKGIKNPGARRYLFTNPAGDTFICEGEFKLFTEKYNLDYACMRLLLTRKTRFKRGKHKDWYVTYID